MTNRGMLIDAQVMPVIDGYEVKISNSIKHTFESPARAKSYIFLYDTHLILKCFASYCRCMKAMKERSLLGKLNAHAAIELNNLYKAECFNLQVPASIETVLECVERLRIAFDRNCPPGQNTKLFSQWCKMSETINQFILKYKGL